MAWLMQEALKNGKIVSIDDVPSGLECNCICPYCGAELIAKKGNIKEYHFAHHNAEDCGKGQETFVHRMAKELILEKEEFTLKEVMLKFKGTPKAEWSISESKTMIFDIIEVEKRINGIIADLYLSIKGKGLIIEIRVTNPVNKSKIEKIKSYNLSCLEINLSKYKDSEIIKDKDVLIEILSYELFNNINNQEWLFNAHSNRIRDHVMSLTKERKVKYVSQNTRYVLDCPLRDNKKLKPTDYNNQQRFCFGCKYFYGGSYRNKVYCLGELKINTYDDYLRYKRRVNTKFKDSDKIVVETELPLE